MRQLLLLVSAAALVTASCGDGSGADAGVPVVRAFAAASLTDAFTELADAFTVAHEDVEVELTFAASSALVAQIDAGAPASVLATADEPTMAAAADAGLVGDARVFARNRLVIAVEPGNRRSIGGLEDLADDGLLFALCAPEVPCGRLGALALARAGVERDATTFGESARAVLTAVELGEVDAGLVYVTDVQASGGAVDGVAFDGADDPELEAVYPIATAGDDVAEASQQFTAFVLSARGQRILRAAGFLPA